MKARILFCIGFLFSLSSFAVDFKQGDGVTLSRDEPLYFKDTVYRQGIKGETFTVHSQNAATNKVYVITKDKQGQSIALNMSDDALAVSPVPTPPAPRPSPFRTPLERKGPGGFLGIPWGAPPNTVMEAMESRKGVSFDSKEASPESLVFAGGTFFEHPVDYTYLTFLDSKLIDGTIAFKFTGHMEGLFSVMLDALSSKYGKGKGFITSGRIEWNFPSSEGPEECISIYITSDRENVMVTYGVLLSSEQAERLRSQKRRKKDGTDDL